MQNGVIKRSLDDRILVYLVDGGSSRVEDLAFAFDTSEGMIRESLRSLESDGYIFDYKMTYDEMLANVAGGDDGSQD